jgi:membrane protease YdiL (CAAX protease family)
MQNINPIKNRENTSIEYVVQKLLAFIFIKEISAIIMEALIIIMFFVFGYDFFSGIMPTGNIVRLISLYGYMGFGIITILYVIKIEKQTLQSIKIKLNSRLLIKFIKNTFFGVLLIGIIITFLCISGFYSFVGFSSKSIIIIISFFVAYSIQSTAEEIMCRGFLQNTLQRKVSCKTAIFFSSIMFMLPHVKNFSEMPVIVSGIAIINLILVSLLFSFAVIKDDSISSACGIHAGWNFALGIIFGLNLSGANVSEGIIQINVNSSLDLITGGSYGIEASIILIPVLLVIDFIYYFKIKKGAKFDGI